MMNRYKVELQSTDWESPLEGLRHKCATSFGKKLRLVEFDRSMPAHWCEKGHFGILLEGRLEIEFDNGTIVFEAGDGICIPDGKTDRHRARVLTDTARVFFVEEDQ